MDTTDDSDRQPSGALSRRAIIGASALGLLGVATACSAGAAPADVVPSPREGTDPRPPGPTTTAAPTTTTVAPLAPTSGPLTLLTPTELNFNALLALGGTAHQTAEIGEMVGATIERVNAAGVSYQTYVDEFMARGDEVAAGGQGGRGRRPSRHCPVGGTVGPPSTTTRGAVLSVLRHRGPGV